MTVCIAAICESSMVIGAADRMITAQDVEFEPPTPKISSVTSSIFLMSAGDSALQAEIIHNIRQEVKYIITADPKKWLRVEDVADLYVKWYSYAKLKRSEAKLLAPIGLDRNTFVGRQHEMADIFINTITKEMLLFELPEVATIVTGIDPTGPHIYAIEDGTVNCFDSVGFVAIGSGAKHAQSQFMFARHSWRHELPETLITAFSAKKRAEVAPGVGKYTDMFLLGPDLGVNIVIDEEIIEDWGKIYNRNAKRERGAQLKAQAEVRKYLEKRAKTEPKGQQQPENPAETDGKQPPPAGQSI